MKKLILIKLLMLITILTYTQEDKYWKIIFHEGIDVYDSLDAHKIISDSIFLRNVSVLPGNPSRNSLIVKDDTLRFWNGNTWFNIGLIDTSIYATKFDIDTTNNKFTNYLLKVDTTVLIPGLSQFLDSLSKKINYTDTNNIIATKADTLNLIATKFDIRKDTISTNTNYYISEISGSDIIGDGSIGNPYATIGFALKKLAPDVVSNASDLYFFVDTGDYDFTGQTANLLHSILTVDASVVRLQGTTILEQSSITVSQDASNPFKYNASGQSWTTDEWAGYFVDETGTLDYFPIESNGADWLIVPVDDLQTTINIVRVGTQLNYGSENLFLQPTVNDKTLTYANLKFNGTGIIKAGSTSDLGNFDLHECIFDCKKLNLAYGQLNRSHILGFQKGVIGQSYKALINNCLIEGDGGASDDGFISQKGYTYFNDVIIKNYGKGFSIETGFSNIISMSGVLMLKDITTGYNLIQGFDYKNLITKMILDNVDYLYLPNDDKNINAVFDTLNIEGSPDISWVNTDNNLRFEPQDNYIVYINGIHDPVMNKLFIDTININSYYLYNDEDTIIYNISGQHKFKIDDTTSTQITKDGISVGVPTFPNTGIQLIREKGELGAIVGIHTKDSARSCGISAINAVGTNVRLYSTGPDYSFQWFKQNSSNSLILGASGIVNKMLIGTQCAAPIILATDTSERMRIDSTGLIGIGDTIPKYPLDIVGLSEGGNSVTSSQIRISSINTDATTKVGNIVGRHYNNSEEDISIIGLGAVADQNIVSIGGNPINNAATTIRFYTSTNNTTLNGILAMSILSSGNININNNIQVEDTTKTAYLNVDSNLNADTIFVKYLESDNEIKAETCLSQSGDFHAETGNMELKGSVASGLTYAILGQSAITFFAPIYGNGTNGFSIRNNPGVGQVLYASKIDANDGLAFLDDDTVALKIDNNEKFIITTDTNYNKNSLVIDSGLIAKKFFSLNDSIVDSITSGTTLLTKEEADNSYLNFNSYVYHIGYLDFLDGSSGTSYNHPGTYAHPSVSNNVIYCPLNLNTSLGGKSIVLDQMTIYYYTDASVDNFDFSLYHTDQDGTLTTVRTFIDIGTGLTGNQSQTLLISDITLSDYAYSISIDVNGTNNNQDIRIYDIKIEYHLE